MEVIIQDKVNTITAKNTVLSAYNAVNLKDERPGVLWVSTHPYDRLTVDLKGSVSAFLLANGRADSGQYWFLITATKTITGITQTNPGVMTTSAEHGYATGDRVYIKNITGMIELNEKTATITNLTDTTFSIGIDTTSYTAWTSGGTVQKEINSGTLDFREIQDWTDYFLAQVFQHKQAWASLTYEAEATTLIIDLKATVDKKGDSITTWDSATSNTFGKLTDAATAVALDLDQIKVGSILTFDEKTETDIRQVTRASGSNNIELEFATEPTNIVNGDVIYFDKLAYSGTDLEINNQTYTIINKSVSSPWTIELASTDKEFVTTTPFSGTDLGECSKIYQITTIKGDGTQNDGVTLSPDPASSTRTVRKILYGISAGVLNSGFSVKFRNPAPGFSDSRDSAATRVLLEDGSMHTRNRKTAREMSGEIFFPDKNEFFKFKGFAENRDAEPIACLIFNNLDTTSRHAGYFKFFAGIPQGRYVGQRLRSMQFSLREII